MREKAGGNCSRTSPSRQGDKKVAAVYAADFAKLDFSAALN
jgi:hypothetical protein